VACWRSEHLPADDGGDTITADELAEIALTVVRGKDAAEPLSLTSTKKERHSWDADFGSPGDAQPSGTTDQHAPRVRLPGDSVERAPLSVSVELPSSSPTSPVLRHRRGARNHPSVVVVTLLVLMVIVVVSLVQWNPPLEEVVTAPPTESSHNVPEMIIADERRDGTGTDALPLTPIEPLLPQHVPQSGEPRITGDDTPSRVPSDRGMPDRPSGDAQQQPRPLIVESPVEEVRDVTGVVTIQTPGSGTWRGIESRGALTVLSTSNSVRCLSLLDSRVILRTAGLGDVVLGTESDVTLSTLPSREPGDRPGSLAIELKQGRFALYMVDAGSSFSLVKGEQQFSCVATETSSLSVESSAAGITLRVYRGSFRIAALELTRRISATLTHAGNWTENSVNAVAESTAWYRERDFRSSLPADSCEQLNSSNDVVSDAQMLVSSQETPTAFLATQVLLQCATQQPASAPSPIFFRLAASGVESQRQSAIHWLVGQLRQRPDDCGLVIQQVCSQMQIATPQQILLRRWYTAAAFGDRPALNQLRELLAGLQNKEHLFVRQSAKYFLQSILGDPLNEFDPARPNDRQAFQAVTRKVRAWQQQNL
jgi:hypothetical protein